MLLCFQICLFVCLFFNLFDNLLSVSLYRCLLWLLIVKKGVKNKTFYRAVSQVIKVKRPKESIFSLFDVAMATNVDVILI